MTVPSLRLIVARLEGCRAQEHGEAHGVFWRDGVAFLLRFYGLLRRGGIVAFEVEDGQI